MMRKKIIALILLLLLILIIILIIILLNVNERVGFDDKVIEIADPIVVFGSGTVEDEIEDIIGFDEIIPLRDHRGGNSRKDECSIDSDCGDNFVENSSFCDLGNVHQRRHIFTCNGDCNEKVESFLVTECEFGCTNGLCNGEPVVKCTVDSDCGVDGFVGEISCNGNDLYQNFEKFKCNNPGNENSLCSSELNLELIDMCIDGNICKEGMCIEINCNNNLDCGIDSNIGDKFCQDDKVFQNFQSFMCLEPGLETSSCRNETNSVLIEDCSFGCDGGECVTTIDVACDFDIDCGIDDFTGDKFCSLDDVHQDFKKWKCENPGTEDSKCSFELIDKIIDECGVGVSCSLGVCVEE